MEQPRTLYDKIIDAHTVRRLDGDSQILLYVDRTVLNEYTSPQAFAGLHEAGRKCGIRPRRWRWSITSTRPRPAGHARCRTPTPRGRSSTSARTARDFGIELFDMLDPRQGIEHVVAPEQGLVLPGMVVAAGDSHTTRLRRDGSAGFRHRHLRDRALSRDADAGLPPPEDDAGRDRRPARRWA